MKQRLVLIFVLVLITIVSATGWASSQMAFWKTPHAVLAHPWFIATLVDTYLAFFTFWVWVAYKETSNLVRLEWLVLIFALGNIAMSAYLLLQLRKLPPDASIESLLLRGK